MGSNIPGGRMLNVVLLLLVVGFVGPAMFPEVPQLSWALWVALAVGTVGGLIVGLAYWGEERRRGKRRALLNQLVAMITRPNTAEARAEANAILKELSTMAVGLPDLVATAGFPEAAATPGPHREVCMRLALRHGLIGGQLWQEVLRRGLGTLRKADLTQDERERLVLWGQTETGRVQRDLTRAAG